MNKAQLTLYWREWRACAAALQGLGKANDDAVRKALQADAIGGIDKSSKRLTNGELTRVLARFRSWSRPADLNAQMHAENEPERTRDGQLAEIRRLAGVVGIRGDLAGVSTYFKNFLGGRAVGIADADTLRKLLFILRRREKEAAAKPAAPAASPAPAPAAAKQPAPAPAATMPAGWDGEF